MKYFLVLILNFLSFKIGAYSNDNFENKLQPEITKLEEKYSNKISLGKKMVVVTANDYATQGARQILEMDGNAVDAAVTIQLILGLVEPQSSGIGGGSFALFYDSGTKQILNYEGREKAPFNVNESLFIDKEGKKLPFYDAVLGGISVGVPGTIDMLFQMHKNHGTLKWEDTVLPAINLAKTGFVPPKRLINSLKKEKFLIKQNPEYEYFKKILNNPKKPITNIEYAETLEKISKNYRTFYEGGIAENIVEKVKNNKTRPGTLNIQDMKNYKSTKTKPICQELKKFIFCGPNLPSSGGISISQLLILYEELKIGQNDSEFNLSLDILNFVYMLRSKFLGDDRFVEIDKAKLLDKEYLKEEFNIFNQERKEVKDFYKKPKFSSTSHFSVADKHGNVVSMTSSIENSFGSRIFVNGFLLNNQLTDFDFVPAERDTLKKNRVQGTKKPLSSMSPTILLDKERNFIFSTGSPGGIAIIAYVFRSIIDAMYKNIEISESLFKGNFLKIRNKIYLEKNKFNIKKISQSLEIDRKKILERNLVSGLAIIKKTKDGYLGAADHRRDGTSFGK